MQEQGPRPQSAAAEDISFSRELPGSVTVVHPDPKECSPGAGAFWKSPIYLSFSVVQRKGEMVRKGCWLSYPKTDPNSPCTGTEESPSLLPTWLIHR